MRFRLRRRFCCDFNSFGFDSLLRNLLRSRFCRRLSCGFNSLRSALRSLNSLRGGFGDSLVSDRLPALNSGFLRHLRRQGLRGCARRQRHGDRGALAALHVVAQRFQDRREGLARTAHQRGHGDRHHEGVAIGGAGRRLARGDPGTIGNGRANQIREALQNIHAHGALAANPEASRQIEPARGLLIGGNRGAAGGGQMGHFVKALHHFQPAVIQRPELGGQRTRRGLQQLLDVEMVRAKAHPQLAQSAAGGLIERFDVGGHARALQHAKRFGGLEGDAARDALKALAGFKFSQRPQ